MKVKNVLKNLSWCLFGIYPVVMILFHMYMCLFNIFWGWLVELTWISIYIPILITFLEQKRWGYIYATLFFSGYQALQIYLGWLTFSYEWMLQCFLPGIFLLILYLNKERYPNYEKYAKIAPIGFCFLCLVYVGFNFHVFVNETFGERAEWQLTGTEKSNIRYENIGGKNNEIFLSRFNDIENHRSILGYLNFESKEFHELMEDGVGLCSNDGQWIYIENIDRKEQNSQGKIIGYCYRYNIHTQRRELLFQADMDLLDHFYLSPNGDKLLVFEGVKVFLDDRRKPIPFQLIESHIPIYMWKQEIIVVEGAAHYKYLDIGKDILWMPKGNNVLVKEYKKNSLEICTPEGTLLENIPLIDEVKESKFVQISPNERYILTKGKGGMYVFDRQAEEREWIKIGEGANEACIANDGTILFNHWKVLLPELYREQWLHDGVEYGLYIYKMQEKQTIRISNNYDMPLGISDDGKTIFFQRSYSSPWGEVKRFLPNLNFVKKIKFLKLDKEYELMILNHK